MDCLTGYIGLKGCTEEQPGSGLWLNTLPGIPAALLTQIANADQVTAKNVKRDIEITAQSQLLSDVTTAFNDRYRMRSIARVMDLGMGIDTASPLAFAALYRGFSIDPQNDLCEGYVKSTLLGISVDEIKFYVSSIEAGATDVTVQVRNLDLGTTLLTTIIPIADVTTGWNTVAINRVFDLCHLAFVIDHTDINTYELPLSEKLSGVFSDCLCQCTGCDGCTGKIQGISIDGATESFTDYSYGVTASVSLTCSYEGLICTNKKTFARALWYLEGHHTMFHAMYTPSFSRYNTVDRDKTQGLMDEYFARYNEELIRVVKGIDLAQNDYCLECNQSIRNEFYTP